MHDARGLIDSDDTTYRGESRSRTVGIWMEKCAMSIKKLLPMYYICDFCLRPRFPEVSPTFPLVSESEGQFVKKLLSCRPTTSDVSLSASSTKVLFSARENILLDMSTYEQSICPVQES